MKTKLIAAVLVATSALLAAPAFASGYGPSPFYNAEVGAPSSQRGPSAQTLMAEQHNAADTRNALRAVGGSVESAASHSSGMHVQVNINGLYRGS
ncbi:hypothetical protein BZM27_23105 [Paraburkholderia steynii]|uniref:DUF4148 domain-containing protein n=1 Tax=Paraburkholderia steynii TaxID=1245441 RepID=A0A4V2NH06_9BURK|nr:hypothetical protein BZM27_23105 [Paraburkholderia steynii]